MATTVAKGVLYFNAWRNLQSRPYLVGAPLPPFNVGSNCTVFCIPINIEQEDRGGGEIVYCQWEVDMELFFITLGMGGPNILAGIVAIAKSVTYQSLHNPLWTSSYWLVLIFHLGSSSGQWMTKDCYNLQGFICKIQAGMSSLKGCIPLEVIPLLPLPRWYQWL